MKKLMVDMDNVITDGRYLDYINEFLNMKTPSRELIVNLIDRIDIYEDKTINIKVCFADN